MQSHVKLSGVSVDVEGIYNIDVITRAIEPGE
jgi:hypothetical protein